MSYVGWGVSEQVGRVCICVCDMSLWGPKDPHDDEYPMWIYIGSQICPFGGVLYGASFLISTEEGRS